MSKENDSTFLDELMIDRKGINPKKLRPRLMKGNIFGYEIKHNELPKLIQAIQTHYAEKELKARIDELTDLVETSKGGFKSLADIRASMEVRLTQLQAQLTTIQKGKK